MVEVKSIEGDQSERECQRNDEMTQDLWAACSMKSGGTLVGTVIGSTHNIINFAYPIFNLQSTRGPTVATPFPAQPEVARRPLPTEPW
jgi:hypothetical protein